MLVLGLKPGEKVLVADNCSIRLVAIAGDKIRIGLDFPAGMPVDREQCRSIKRSTNEHVAGQAIFHKGRSDDTDT